METLCSGPGVYSCATACSCRMSLRRPARVADLHACVRRCQPSSSLPHLLGALLVIVLLAHLALVGKARDVVPPLPGLPTLVGQLEHAQLPQVLLRGSARSPSGQPGTCTARCPAASSHELSTLPSADGPPRLPARARAPLPRPTHRMLPPSRVPPLGCRRVRQSLHLHLHARGAALCTYSGTSYNQGECTWCPPLADGLTQNPACPAGLRASLDRRRQRQTQKLPGSPLPRRPCPALRSSPQPSVSSPARRTPRAARLDDVGARVAGGEVAVGVGRAVAPLVDALALALVAVAVRLRADPHDVVRRELGPVALQLPRHVLVLLPRGAPGRAPT
jgi:hypothetical protein